MFALTHSLVRASIPERSLLERTQCRNLETQNLPSEIQSPGPEIANNRNYFGSLPKDLQIEIVRHLPMESIKQIIRLCKSTNAACLQPMALKKIQRRAVNLPLTWSESLNKRSLQLWSIINRVYSFIPAPSATIENWLVISTSSLSMVSLIRILFLIYLCQSPEFAATPQDRRWVVECVREFECTMAGTVVIFGSLAFLRYFEPQASRKRADRAWSLARDIRGAAVWLTPSIPTGRPEKRAILPR